MIKLALNPKVALKQGLESLTAYIITLMQGDIHANASMPVIILPYQQQPIQCIYSIFLKLQLCDEKF